MGPECLQGSSDNVKRGVGGPRWAESLVSVFDPKSPQLSSSDLPLISQLLTRDQWGLKYQMFPPTLREVSEMEIRRTHTS